MESHNSGRVASAVLIAAAIFGSVTALRHFFAGGLVSSMIVGQSAELILPILAVIIFGKSRFADYGFCLPRKAASDAGGPAFGWLALSAAAFGLGALASIVMVGLGGSGIPAVKEMTPGQMVLFVWIISSVVEEVLTRGFLFGHISGMSDVIVGFGKLRVPLPVLISAVFFSCMHIVVIFAGADAVTASIILPFTFLLGLVAGYGRLKSGSLLPAIGLHVLANVGGVVGGIIATIVKVLAGGSPI